MNARALATGSGTPQSRRRAARARVAVSVSYPSLIPTPRHRWFSPSRQVGEMSACGECVLSPFVRLVRSDCGCDCTRVATGVESEAVHDCTPSQQPQSAHGTAEQLPFSAPWLLHLHRFASVTNLELLALGVVDDLPAVRAFVPESVLDEQAGGCRMCRSRMRARTGGCVRPSRVRPTSERPRVGPCGLPTLRGRVGTSASDLVVRGRCWTSRSNPRECASGRHPWSSCTGRERRGWSRRQVRCVGTPLRLVRTSLASAAPLRSRRSPRTSAVSRRSMVARLCSSYAAPSGRPTR